MYQVITVKDALIEQSTTQVKNFHMSCRIIFCKNGYIAYSNFPESIKFLGEFPRMTSIISVIMLHCLTYVALSCLPYLSSRHTVVCRAAQETGVPHREYIYRKKENTIFTPL